MKKLKTKTFAGILSITMLVPTLMSANADLVTSNNSEKYIGNTFNTDSSSMNTGAVNNSINTNNINTTTLSDRNSDHYIGISGRSRIDTAIGLSLYAYKDRVDDVIVASGDSYPDALAGSSLAGILNAPLLLTSRHTPSKALLSEISRLRPRRVYILGGYDSISSGVEQKIRDYRDNIVRLAGINRYETSIRIAERVRSIDKTMSTKAGRDVSSSTIIVNGKNFPDALSAGSLAAKLRAPIILTNGSSLPNEYEKVMSRYANDANIVVGGTDSVNIPNMTATRVSGNDRYETAIAVAEKYFPDTETIAIASGRDYPDGLSSITLYGKYQMPILLTSPYKLPAKLEGYIKDKSIKQALVVGGVNSIGIRVRSQINTLIGDNKNQIKTPTILAPIEEGQTEIKIDLGHKPANSGQLYLYKLDKDGKTPAEPIKKLDYTKDQSATILTVTGLTIKKGDQFVAKRVETVKEAITGEDRVETSKYSTVVKAEERVITGVSVKLYSSEDMTDAKALKNNQVVKLSKDGDTSLYLAIKVDKIGNPDKSKGKVECAVLDKAASTATDKSADVVDPNAKLEFNSTTDPFLYKGKLIIKNGHPNMDIRVKAKTVNGLVGYFDLEVFRNQLKDASISINGKDQTTNTEFKLEDPSNGVTIGYYPKYVGIFELTDLKDLTYSITEYKPTKEGMTLEKFEKIDTSKISLVFTKDALKKGENSYEPFISVKLKDTNNYEPGKEYAYTLNLNYKDGRGEQNRIINFVIKVPQKNR